jgi:hypothetical protein
VSMFKWEKSEALTTAIYGVRVPRSGSGWTEKLDTRGTGIFEGFRIENKFTEGKTFTLNKDKLKAAMQQAASMGAQPMWLIDFEGERHVCMNEEAFLGFIGSIYEEKDGV